MNTGRQIDICTASGHNNVDYLHLLDITMSQALQYNHVQPSEKKCTKVSSCAPFHVVVVIDLAPHDTFFFFHPPIRSRHPGALVLTHFVQFWVSIAEVTQEEVHPGYSRVKEVGDMR